MAASIFLEEESGTYTGRIHPHNGYYAGDFSTPWHERRRNAGTQPFAPAPRVTVNA